MGEVEAQACRFHHAACLLYMRPENAAERGLQQVGCRVVAHGGHARFTEHLSLHFVANVNGSESGDAMDVEALHGRVDRLYVSYFVARRRVERSLIPNLAARFRVERSAVEDQFALLRKRY